MKVRFVLEFSRLKALQLPLREFCLNMLKNTSNISCKMMVSSSSLNPKIQYLYTQPHVHASMLITP